MKVHLVSGVWRGPTTTYVAFCGAPNPALGWWTINRALVTCGSCLESRP